jgi:Transposase IS4
VTEFAATAGFGIRNITGIMSQDRYVQYKANVRFVPKRGSSYEPRVPKTDPCYDRLWKIRPLLEAILEACRANGIPGRFITLDEMMVFTKSTLSCTFLVRKS